MIARRIAVIVVPLLLGGAFAPPAAAKPAKGKGKVATLTLPVEGITAKTKGKALKAVEKAAKKVKGVVSVKVDKKSGHLLIKHKPSATPEAIEAALTKAGFKITKDEPVPVPEPIDEELGDGADDFDE